MYKVQIDDLIVFCETPDEVMALAAKRSAAKASEKSGYYSNPYTANVSHSDAKNADRIKVFLNTISRLSSTSVSSGTLAEALGVSPNGLGPMIASMCKKHGELKTVISRVGPQGQAGRWIVNKAALEKLSSTEKSA